MSTTQHFGWPGHCLTASQVVMKRTNPFAHLAFQQGKLDNHKDKSNRICRSLNRPCATSTQNASTSARRISTQRSANTDDNDHPFVAPAPAKYRDRFGAVCDECFHSSRICSHHPEKRLITLIVGVNPSEASWNVGFNYAHKSNLMWRLLTGKSRSEEADFVGMVDASLPLDAQNHLPIRAGIGFADLGTVCGSDSAQFSSGLVRNTWAPDFYSRVRKHLRRCQSAAATAEAATAETIDVPAVCPVAIGPMASTDLDDGEITDNGTATGKIEDTSTSTREARFNTKACHSPSRDDDSAATESLSGADETETSENLWRFAPRIVAFAGKSHFMKLLGSQAMRLDEVIDPSDRARGAPLSRGCPTRNLTVSYGETMLRTYSIHRLWTID
jgi:hypothetical protein